MSNFKESEIIVWGDDFYICKIAGANESVFIKATIGVGSYCSTSTECGIVLPSDISKFTIGHHSIDYKYFKNQERYNKPQRDPRVGIVNGSFGFGVHLDLNALRDNNLKLYTEYITKLYNDLKPTINTEEVIEDLSTQAIDLIEKV